MLRKKLQKRLDWGYQKRSFLCNFSTDQHTPKLAFLNICFSNYKETLKYSKIDYDSSCLDTQLKIKFMSIIS